MIRFYNRGAISAVIIVLIALIAGCGGGGGGGSTPSSNYVITGTIWDQQYKGSPTTGAISGAVVIIGTKSTTTDANGKFKLEFASPPAVSTWSVDGANAKPDPGFYNFWAKMGIVTATFDARTLPMPSITEKNITMPTVYLWSESSPPPPS